VSGSTL
ncbi:hypothetical protein N7482_000001, partial [Penicillium canariense]